MQITNKMQKMLRSKGKSKGKSEQGQIMSLAKTMLSETQQPDQS